MLIIPAIDLKDGCVVRYVQGKLNKKVYSRDPVKTARHWVKSGAKMLHIVDLDGAFTGVPKNLNLVKQIAQEVKVPLEFGGGVRDFKTIKDLFASGIGRVVLGTRAIKDAAFLKKAALEFGPRVIVSLDAKNKELAVEGWKKSDKSQDVVSFALGLKKLGFKQVIYTDTLKDGTLSGPNIQALKDLLKQTGLQVIASGGISSLEDISRLKKIERSGVVGVIVGKALYEGKFTLAQALKLA